MGTYKLSENGRYRFAASAGDPVMTFASDGVGDINIFRNKIKIDDDTGSDDIDIDMPCLHILHGRPDTQFGQIFIQNTGSGDCFIGFDGGSVVDGTKSKYQIGVDASDANGPSFKIGQSSTNIMGSSIRFKIHADTGHCQVNQNLLIRGNLSGMNPDHELNVHGDDDATIICLMKNHSSNANAECLALRINKTTLGTSNNILRFEKSNGDAIDVVEGDGAGGARFTGESAGTYSDMRNKQNIVYLKEDNYCAGDILKQLDVLEYELKTDVRPVKLRHVGFSAQQLLELWPYPVTKFDEDNKKTGAKPGDSNFKYHKLNQGQMTPLIVKTIQEQMKTIELLTSRVEELEKRLEK